MLMGFEVPSPPLICLHLPQVDTLEIALREQLGMVDAIFLVESVLTHKGVSNSIYLCSHSIYPSPSV